MVGHKTDTFYWEFSPHNICEVNYTEYNEDGDYFTPPHHEIEINKITLNGDCVTDVLEVYYDEIVQQISDR